MFVSSGSTANLLLVASVIERYALQKNDKVIVPATTWVTNVNPIMQLGLKPIFCDIDLKNYSFDLEHLKKLAEKHPDIKMVFTTHLLGVPAPVDEYKKILPNAIFIDDVCEAQGSVSEDMMRVGANSLGATYSFYFGHHMSTVEGGMIATNDTDLYDMMKVKRSHGMSRVSDYVDGWNAMYADLNIDPQFLFVTDGYNFRNTELAAMLGRRQLKRINKSVRIRRERYTEYYELLEKYEKLFHMPEFSYGNSCFCFPFIMKDKKMKNVLVTAFKLYGIEYRPIVGGNLLKQPYLLHIKTKAPNADILHENGVYIGCNQFTTAGNMKTLDEILGRVYNEFF